MMMMMMMMMMMILMQKQPPEVFCKKVVLKNFADFTGKHPFSSFFLIKLQAWRPATLLKKTPAQIFSCEICRIFKNTYFQEHLQTAASDDDPFNCLNHVLSVTIYVINES